MDYYMHSSLLNTYGFVLANCRYEWRSGFSHCPHTRTHRMTCNVLRFWQIPASFQMFSSFQKNYPLLHSDTKISAGMPHSWNTCDGSVSKCPMHEWIVENLSIFRTIRSARIKMDFYTHSSSMHTYGFILANCR